DATPADRQGEAFGLWGAMQMAGLLLGPAIGGIGAAVFGSVAFVFIFGGISAVLAALAVWAGVRDVPRREVGPRSEILAGLPAAGLADFQRDFARDLLRLDLT
ncbi:MAG: MFS transporter, partial [Chloroflexi bacterium]